MRFEDLTSRSFYERVIAEALLSNVPREPNKLYVTEVARCLRESYFRRTRPQAFMGTQAVRAFIGKLVHEGLESLVVNALRSASHEVRRELDLGDVKVSGRADVVSVGDQEVIVEFKTCGDIPSEPYQDHIKQLKYYMAMFGIRRGVLVYISRDGEILPYIVSLDSPKSVMEEIAYRARALYEALTNGRPPKPEKGEWCGRCAYRFECLKK